MRKSKILYNLFIIGFLLFSYSVGRGQNPKVKKEIVIRNTIDNKGISSIDTSEFNTYDHLGRMIFSHNPSQHGDCSATVFKYLEEKITIDSNSNHLHQVLIYNDSSRTEIYYHYYKDSVVSFYEFDNNNNNKFVQYLKRNKTTRYSRYFAENYDVSFDKYIIKKNLIFSKNIEVVKDMNGGSDSTLHKSNRILNILKVYSFNTIENKWELKLIQKNNWKHLLIKEISFVNCERTKTKFKYNSSGKLNSEISCNPHFGKIKKNLYLCLRVIVVRRLYLRT